MSYTYFSNTIVATVTYIYLSENKFNSETYSSQTSIRYEPARVLGKYGNFESYQQVDFIHMFDQNYKI